MVLPLLVHPAANRTVGGTLGGTWSEAKAINDKGQVAGFSFLIANGANVIRRAFFWNNGIMTDLGTFGGNHAGAYGINEKGQIVGWALNASNVAKAFRWENGVKTDLGTLGGDSYASDINETGQVVGYSTTSTGQIHACLWENGVKAFNFRYVVPVGNACMAGIDPVQHGRLAEHIWNLGQKLGMIIGFSDPFPELFVNPERLKEVENNPKLATGEAVTGCSVAFSLLYINPQGIIQFCPYFPVEVDDAKKVSIDEIWYHNEKFNLFRHSRTFLNGNCGKCKYKYACGGCRGAAFAGGDYLGEDPRCWINF